MKRTALMTIMVLACVVFASRGWAGTVVSVEVDPSSFQIGTFFHGRTLKVSGTLPEGCEAVVRFEGIPKDLHLKKKGKAFGLLWMNMGTITFHDVPNVMLVYTAKPMEELVSEGVDTPDSVRKLGFHGLKDQVGLEPEGEDKDLLFGELLKLKRQEGLYLQESGVIGYGQGAGGNGRTFSLLVQVPPRLTAGSYMVEAYAVRDGRIVGEASVPIQVGLKGAPAFLSKLAFQHGLLYGIMATIVAIGGGLLMGFLFGAGKGAH